MSPAPAAARPVPQGTPLQAELARRIAQDGPMTVAEFMAACLHHPRHGYYATRPALGEAGDFLTAPLVSQMFGELIGAWLAEIWRQMGRPDPVRLVELGPGDGTLMADALRAMAAAPGLREALDLWLVEPSAPLRALQADRLAGAGPRFADGLRGVAAGAPMLLVANELFDCLPARQFVRTAKGWAERRVGLGDRGELAFGLAPLPGGAGADLPCEAAEGAVVERSPAQTALAAEIGRRLARDGGAALVIDYGAAEPGPGDTLQAVAGHRKVDPLAAPGEADLTVHVDFGALAAAARGEGVAVSAVMTQGELLRALGIEARAARLAQGRPDLADRFARQLARLTAPDQMGELFKALAFHSPGLAAPGFAPQGFAPQGTDERRRRSHPDLAVAGSRAGVRHAFFTRRGGVSQGLYASLNVGLGSRDDADAVAENRARAAAAFGQPVERLMTCYQVHSARAVTADGAWGGARHEADGIATATAGLVCGALSADCAPVLLADPQARVVAAVHAGWRGALAGVVQATVEQMTALGALPDRIRAVVGPCIGPHSYEVGADFHAAFMTGAPEAVRFFRPGAAAGKHMFDLPGFVLDRLARAGVGEAVWIGRDTYADEAAFFSNRRAVHRGEGDYGRLLSAIMLEP